MNAFKMVKLHFVITLSKRIHNLEIYWLNIFILNMRVSCKIKLKMFNIIINLKILLCTLWEHLVQGTFGTIRQKSWDIKKIGTESQ